MADHIDDLDFAQMVSEIKNQIEHLEKEEEIEQEIINEQKDAEQKLADALQRLKNEESVFRAILYFTQVNLDDTQAQVHKEVEEIISLVNSENVGGPEIQSAEDLQNAFGEVEETLREIEEAEQELRDAYNKTKKDLKDEKEEMAEAEDISKMISQIQNGESKYRAWARGGE